jgi:hypothetical protein
VDTAAAAATAIEDVIAAAVAHTTTTTPAAATTTVASCCHQLQVALYNCALLALLNGVITAVSGAFVLTTIVKGVTLNLGCLMTISLLFIPKALLIRSSPNSDAPPVKRQSFVTDSMTTAGRLSGTMRQPKGSTAKSQHNTGRAYMVQPSSRAQSGSESSARGHSSFETPSAAAAAAAAGVAAAAGGVFEAFDAAQQQQQQQQQGVTRQSDSPQAGGASLFARSAPASGQRVMLTAQLSAVAEERTRRGLSGGVSPSAYKGGSRASSTMGSRKSVESNSMDAGGASEL